MPRSTNIFKDETIKFITDKYAPSITILDIGCGCGTYSDLLKPKHENIDGLEIHEPYVEMFGLKQKYSNLFINDATKFDYQYYDLMIVGDILEHIEESEGVKFIERIYDKCDDMIIAIPFNSPQGVHYENEYEIHRQEHLTNESFLEKYKGFKVLCLRYDYGIYVKDTPSNSKCNIYLDPINLNFNEVKNNLNVKFPSSTVINYLENNVEVVPPEINNLTANTDLTIVTGLWNIGRTGREFTHYIEHFKKFLEIPNKMFIYIPQEYEYLVWESRSKENTYVKICELSDIKELYAPFWDQTQKIRTNPEWFNMTGENGWLSGSPQATLEWYNPIVQSKMFLLNNATIWNPFGSEYFIWLDAGITNTVYEGYFTENRVLDKITPYLDNFLFLSYPYETNSEIHGFEIEAMNQYADDSVKYVCRGGLFGGKKEDINQANGTYYSTLLQTLNNGHMGTEESVFAIMSYKEPNIYQRYSLDGNGLIVKFINDLINNNVTLEESPIPMAPMAITQHEVSKVKTNVYILTFNFPEQVQHTINTMEKVPEWLSIPHLVLIDNSTSEEAKSGNIKIAEKYNMEYVSMPRNTGICGGRQKAAEHFHESDADYMFFFEDDMTVNPKELKGEFCRNGFRKYVPDLYNILHKIMLKENFDFLKMSFTEVYFDNDVALPWYNVPQNIRTRDWPDYDKLPVTGLDPNAPKASYLHIKILDGVAYIIGEVNYCNWPMIVSKSGNKKMFIDTKWDHPYEQTWSSHIYQLTKEGKIHSAVLLASPIWHDRILYYKAEERREN